MHFSLKPIAYVEYVALLQRDRLKSVGEGNNNVEIPSVG